MRSGLTNDISGALSDAISDYAMDNDMDEDEVYDEIYSEYEDIDLFYKALDYIDNNVNEGYDTVNWKHFDNDKRRYDLYVLVDNSDESVIDRYRVLQGEYWKDILDAAIKDADDLARKNRYGSYSVYGCEMYEYDEDINQQEIIGRIKNISEQVDEELEKEDIDEDKLFKLRYAQFIQGLHLNLNNNFYNR